MYGIAFFKRHDDYRHYPMYKTWQADIRELYGHYFLMDLLLSQSTWITDKTRKRFQQQQQRLTEALEEFTNELDESAIGPYSIKQAIFRKHLDTMQLLNESAVALVLQHQFSIIKS